MNNKFILFIFSTMPRTAEGKVVRIEDKDGNLCPMADNLVTFEVKGAGDLIAVDNGNSATTESFQASDRKAFSGMFGHYKSH